MAKKKSRKKAESASNVSLISKKITWGLLFIELILIVIFVYGAYIIIFDFERWGDGLSIIAASLLGWIILKFISKLRKK